MNEIYKNKTDNLTEQKEINGEKLEVIQQKQTTNNLINLKDRIEELRHNYLNYLKTELEKNQKKWEKQPGRLVFENNALKRKIKSFERKINIISSEEEINNLIKQNIDQKTNFFKKNTIIDVTFKDLQDQYSLEQIFNYFLINAFIFSNKLKNKTLIDIFENKVDDQNIKNKLIRLNLELEENIYELYELFLNELYFEKEFGNENDDNKIISEIKEFGNENDDNKIISEIDETGFTRDEEKNIIKFVKQNQAIISAIAKLYNKYSELKNYLNTLENEYISDVEDKKILSNYLNDINPKNLFKSNSGEIFNSEEIINNIQKNILSILEEDKNLKAWEKFILLSVVYATRSEGSEGFLNSYKQINIFTKVLEELVLVEGLILDENINSVEEKEEEKGLILDENIKSVKETLQSQSQFIEPENIRDTNYLNKNSEKKLLESFNKLTINEKNTIYVFISLSYISILFSSKLLELKNNALQLLKSYTETLKIPEKYNSYKNTFVNNMSVCSNKIIEIKNNATDIIKQGSNKATEIIKGRFDKEIVNHNNRKESIKNFTTEIYNKINQNIDKTSKYCIDKMQNLFEIWEQNKPKIQIEASGKETVQNSQEKPQKQITPSTTTPKSSETKTVQTTSQLSTPLVKKIQELRIPIAIATILTIIGCCTIAYKFFYTPRIKTQPKEQQIFMIQLISFIIALCFLIFLFVHFLTQKKLQTINN